MPFKTYTTFKAAHLVGVQPTTIIKWAREKKLKVYTTVGGHRRILHSDLIDFMKHYKLPIPPELQSYQSRILIVDDDDTVGPMLKKSLQGVLKEVKVDWIKDAVEALIAVGKNPPDLIILDVVMPVMDGARVLATFRADPVTSKVKVIGMTGKKLSPEKLKFMQSNTDEFILKPFKMDEFIEKVAKLLKYDLEPVFASN